jgi:hypothetical protein
MQAIKNAKIKKQYSGGINAYLPEIMHTDSKDIAYLEYI